MSRCSRAHGCEVKVRGDPAGVRASVSRPAPAAEYDRLARCPLVCALSRSCCPPAHSKCMNSGRRQRGGAPAAYVPRGICRPPGQTLPHYARCTERFWRIRCDGRRRDKSSRAPPALVWVSHNVLCRALLTPPPPNPTHRQPPQISYESGSNARWRNRFCRCRGRRCHPKSGSSVS